MRWFVARLTAQTRDDRGVALFAAIAGMVLLSTMIAALVILARNENMIAQLNKDEAQAAYAAEAGANWGRRLLLQRLSVDLPAAVSAAGRTAMKAALVSTYNSANGGAQFTLARLFGHVWGLNGVAAAGLVAGAVTALPASLVLLRRAQAVSMAALAKDVIGAWASRVAPLLAVALTVGLFRVTLGSTPTVVAAVTIGLVYVWRTRPLYRILPLDPRWVRWLVSLRPLPPLPPVPSMEQG